ncbi:hypothetical protein TWF788_009557 [Orbilia oligospora]|uniref:Nudix hydrolase domain-containing protein n=1 Tax=Orbilia oligospora TaxID=2813651 RepID=A0A6G1LXV9_ORBOL|nr:hypothetical protein TWF788_009557 [Orbilia oligospora]KAF3211656.1 hypothetical protein TWF191_010731 [Orbilia oligospora]KAF3237151.1 hypothetical protein TWF192_010980 [Orbilia oligospora]
MSAAPYIPSDQPPPALVDHTYAFSPEVEQYNKPLEEIILLNAPRDTIGVGAFVFKPSSSGEPLLLLIRRSASESAYPEMYEVPGGGAEAPPIDATLLDSVARELFEETGLVATRIVKLIDTADFQGRRGDLWRKFNFEIEVQDSEDVVLQPSEHDEFKWVGKEGFEKLIASGEMRTMPSQQITIRRAFDAYGL